MVPYSSRGAAIVRNLKRMCGFNDYEEIIHRDKIPLAIKESEKNVQTIIYVIKGRLITHLKLNQKMIKPAR